MVAPYKGATQKLFSITTFAIVTDFLPTTPCVAHLATVCFVIRKHFHPVIYMMNQEVVAGEGPSAFSNPIRFDWVVPVGSPMNIKIHSKRNWCKVVISIHVITIAQKRGYQPNNITRFVNSRLTHSIISSPVHVEIPGIPRTTFAEAPQLQIPTVVMFVRHIGWQVFCLGIQ